MCRRSFHLPGLAMVAFQAIPCLASPLPPPTDREMVELINTTLADYWTRQKIEPSAKATDLQFIRRAALDYRWPYCQPGGNRAVPARPC